MKAKTIGKCLRVLIHNKLENNLNRNDKILINNIHKFLDLNNDL